MYKRNSLFVSKISKYNVDSFCKNEDIAYKLANDSLIPFRSNSFSAWKLGGATLANRKYFNIDHIFWGELTHKQVKEFNQKCDFQLKSLKAEGEISLKINVNLSTDFFKFIDHISDNDLFESFCYCIEMPDCGIDDLNHNIYALLSDRCASGALILGDWININLFNNNNIYTFKILDKDSQQILAFGNSDILLSSPISLARTFIKNSIKKGFIVKPGDIISTGGITPCINLSCNKNYVLVVNNQKIFSINTFKVDDDSYSIR